MSMSSSGGVPQPQQYSLKWNDYSHQVVAAFDDLRREDDLTDVTLSCEGCNIKAHKVLLSACSLYFKNTFKENPCKHPIIILKGVPYRDLESVVTFMYNGQVNVSQDRLSSFLETAELLQIKGLSDANKGSGSFNANSGPGSTNTKSRKQKYQPPLEMANSSFEGGPEGARPPSPKRRKAPSQATGPQIKSVESLGSAPAMISDTHQGSLGGEEGNFESKPSDADAGSTGPDPGSNQGDDNEDGDLDSHPDPSVFIPGTVLKFDNSEDDSVEYDNLDLSDSNLDISVSSLTSYLGHHVGGGQQETAGASTSTAGKEDSLPPNNTLEQPQVQFTPELVFPTFLRRKGGHRQHCLLLWHNDRLYGKYVTDSKGLVNWRCTRHSSLPFNCRGRIREIGNEFWLIKPHTCLPRPPEHMNNLVPIDYSEVKKEGGNTLNSEPVVAVTVTEELMNAND